MWKEEADAGTRRRVGRRRLAGGGCGKVQVDGVLIQYRSWVAGTTEIGDTTMNGYWGGEGGVLWSREI